MKWEPSRPKTNSANCSTGSSIDPAFRDRALQQLEALPIALDPETDTFAWTATLRLADRFGLTLYDAAYLELAQRRVVPLASLDKALRGAGQAFGLTLIGVGS